MSKPPTTLHPTTTLHPLTTLTGTHPLTIGLSTYIHLRAHLNTTHAPVTIHDHCIIGEKSIIGIQDASPAHISALDQTGEKEGKEGGDGGGSGEGKLEGKEGEVVELQSHISIAPNTIIESRKIGTGTEVC
ncbi:MAG: hypothetical protein LQ349_009822, partial [Xanthoria aureola]